LGFDEEDIFLQADEYIDGTTKVLLKPEQRLSYIIFFKPLIIRSASF